MTRDSRPVLTGGPDAVHLGLTVRGRPHPYGCAWASYGEARPPLPVSRGRRTGPGPGGRARPLPGPAAPPAPDAPPGAGAPGGGVPYGCA